MNEFELIERYFQRKPQRKDVLLTVGHDAALIQPPTQHLIANTIDTLIENTHFLATVNPEDLGYKSLAVNLSDLAAIGAKPAWFFLALTIPQAKPTWLESFSRGLLTLAQAFDMDLIGGDTTKGSLSITIQAQGLITQDLVHSRLGAKPGDLIYVTGTLGDAALGLELAKKPPSSLTDAQKFLLNRYHRPTPRIEAGLKLGGIASSAIDISDGLYLVYRENILRFFSPFDHQDPWYIYFYYLPLYLLPWTLLLIPFFLHFSARWKQFNSEQKAVHYSFLILFLFFILSGSRRSYYILPLIPLCVLLLSADVQTWKDKTKQIFKKIIGIFYIFYFLFFGVAQPMYYAKNGVKPFAVQIKQAAVSTSDWANWQVVMVGADDRVAFYLHPHQPSKSYAKMNELKQADLAPYHIIITQAVNLRQLPYLGPIKVIYPAFSSNNSAMVAVLYLARGIVAPARGFR